jgi:uncharacterized protein (TIGR02246 family)
MSELKEEVLNNMESKEEKMNFKEIAKKNFSAWNEMLQSRDPKKVAELYKEDATFLPTVSPEFKTGKEGACDYFEHFLAKNPNGEIKGEVVQPLGDATYLHSGMYDFEVDGKDGRIIVEARFSYVWQKNNNDEWKILHHHSSVKPE